MSTSRRVMVRDYVDVQVFAPGFHHPDRRGQEVARARPPPPAPSPREANFCRHFRGMAAEVGLSRGPGRGGLWKTNGAAGWRRRRYADAPVLPVTGTPGARALRACRGMADGPHPRAGTWAGPGGALLGCAHARALGDVPRPSLCRRPDPRRRRGVLRRHGGSTAGTSAPATVGRTTNRSTSAARPSSRGSGASASCRTEGSSGGWSSWPTACPALTHSRRGPISPAS